jgi:hypothetical protein
MKEGAVPWRTDREATRLAAELFEGSPVVRRNGEQYMVSETPFGRMELVRLPGRQQFLAAVERPPEDPSFDPASLPADVSDHLERNGLRPWRIVVAPTGDVAEALRRLARGGGAEPVAAPIWSPFACPVEEAGEVIGEARGQAVEEVAGLVAARRNRSPVPVLLGHDGVGKHVVAAAAARRLGKIPVELPLGRLLADRVFATGMELFLQTVLTARAHMTGTVLLIVSGAEVAVQVPPRQRRQIGEELSRLPDTVLAGTAPPPLPLVVPVVCPALTTTGQIGALIEAHHPGLGLEEPALNMVARSAHVPPVGFIPARVLFLVRLALSLNGDRPVRLSPDDMAHAARLAASCWGSDGAAAEDHEA